MSHSLVTALHFLANWCAANPNAAITILVGALTLTANGLLKSGHAPGVVGAIGKLVNLLSPFTRKDAAGTFKLPFTKANLEAEAVKAITDPPLPVGLVGPGLVILAALACGGCTPAYVTAGATARAVELAIGSYQIATHTIRRQLVAPCTTASAPVACREAALAAFEAQQLPVLACVEALAPVVIAAEAACQAKDVAAAESVLPQLAGPGLACVTAIQAVITKGAR